MKNVFKKIDGVKTGIFAAGVLFGTAGIKILSSQDAKKVYTNCTAAVLRAKKCVMKTATTIQENAGDIYAEAKAINDERESAEEVVDDTVELNEVSEETESTDCFKVSGRGELHLSVLIENMRREGYEFAVSKPEVLYKTDDRGKKLEPMEIAYVDVPEEFSGTVIQKLSERKGELQGMSTASDGTVRLEFHIPSRGLIGFRGEFLTSTKGTGIINTMFDGYAPYKGDFQYRKQGSLIAFEAGEAVTYGLFAAQERGTLFIGPGAKVYSGMVIGQNGKAEDIELNVCKTKHLTNTRSSSADDSLKLTPPRVLSLEQAIDFIDQDELLEVTPESLRIRKRLLDSRERKRAAFRKA